MNDLLSKDDAESESFYDSQFLAIQNQLLDVMIENQNLIEEVKLLKEPRGEQKQEKEKLKSIVDRLHEKEGRERERPGREKSLPPGEKSPSLPQRIKKRINKIHKNQSSDLDEDNQGDKMEDFSFPQTRHPASQLQSISPNIEKSNRKLPSPYQSPKNLFSERLSGSPSTQNKFLASYPSSSKFVPYLPSNEYSETPPPSRKNVSGCKNSPSLSVSSSRGRFGWRKRGLEKSKSLDQSEFLSSLAGVETKNEDQKGAESKQKSPPDWLDVPRLCDQLDSDSEDGDLTPGHRTPDTRRSRLFNRTPETPLPVARIGPKPKVVEGPPDSFRTKLERWMWWMVTEVIKDFSEVQEEEVSTEDPEGDPLTVKKLKENVVRFSAVMRPATETYLKICSLFKWESPSATFLAMVLYIYAVLWGWTLTLVLVILIYKLSVNYFKKRGWSMQLFDRLRRRDMSDIGEPATGDGSLGDKFALVLQVARRVQNLLGNVSDAAEKYKNLLMWEHEATKRLYFFLWAVLGASLVLSTSQIFTLFGLYLAVKLFILDYLFFRYPRIRQKYDSTSKLWDTLPTDSELNRKKDMKTSENGLNSPDVAYFLDLFGLPTSEMPLPGWMGGKRCTLVNRDRSLTSAFKNGRLYLTNRLGKPDKPDKPNKHNSMDDGLMQKRGSIGEINKKEKDEDVFDLILRKFIESVDKPEDAEEQPKANDDDKPTEEVEVQPTLENKNEIVNKWKKTSLYNKKRKSSFKRIKDEEKVEDIAESCLKNMFSDDTKDVGNQSVKVKKKFPPVVLIDRTSERHNSESSVKTDSPLLDKTSFRKKSIHKKRALFQKSMSEQLDSPPISPRLRRRLTPSPLAFSHNDSDNSEQDRDKSPNKLRVKSISYLDHDKIKPSVFDKVHDQVFSGV